MGRLLGVHLQEHQYNLKQGLTEKSKLAQNACDGCCIIWKEANVLQDEMNHIWRK
jgi:hypothetical protein